MATSTFGAPQFFRNFGSSTSGDFDEFMLPKTGDHIITVPGQGPSYNTALGKFPLGQKRNEEMTRYLPVMKALLKVMKTNKAAPEDVNTLLVLSRDLQKYAPKGNNQFGGIGILDSFGGMEGMGLPETGDLIINVNGEPHIRTEFGTFPLPDESLMTDAERELFLPSIKTFISILEKDDLDADEMNTILSQSRELINLIPDNFSGQFGLSGFGK